jgi:hypothetical protein
MCRNFNYGQAALSHQRRPLLLRSLDHPIQNLQSGKALEFVGLVADCVSVILAEFEELGFSEEDALRLAAGYVAEVLPILRRGPWPLSSISWIFRASSRSELEAAAAKLRRLANVRNLI